MKAILPRVLPGPPLAIVFMVLRPIMPSLTRLIRPMPAPSSRRLIFLLKNRFSGPVGFLPELQKMDRLCLVGSKMRTETLRRVPNSSGLMILV